MNGLQEAIEKVLACPSCECRLAVKSDSASVVCAQCSATYSIIDGIPVLLPNGPSARQDKRLFRASQASQYEQSSRDESLSRASSLYALDAEIDASLGNLEIGKRLPGDQESVVFICGNPAALPILKKEIAGIWSVQVFQHFLAEVMSRVRAGLDRVLQDNFCCEIYSLNPALLQQAIYRLLGRRLHRLGRLGEMEWNRLSAHEWKAVWREFRKGQPQITSKYSELFFHPGFHLRPRRYPISLKRAPTMSAPGLSALFARQCPLRIESRTVG